MFLCSWVLGIYRIFTFCWFIFFYFHICSYFPLCLWETVAMSYDQMAECIEDRGWLPGLPPTVELKCSQVFPPGVPLIFMGLLGLERQTSTIWNDRMVELWSNLRTQWEQKERTRVLGIEVAKIWVPFYELKECNSFGFWIFYLVLIRWKILTQHFSGSHHKAKHIFKVLLWDFFFNLFCFE